MSEKLEVGFNSPQCGWMSVGFKNNENEFSSTTAHTPHERALPELLQILTRLLDSGDFETTLFWSRNPEKFDFLFENKGEEVSFAIYEYRSEKRSAGVQKNRVFTHSGHAREFCEAFYKTFTQLHEDRETDEFEANWKQPFPFTDFEKFELKLKSAGS